jgi:phospholipid/cholesterol/gamma-HCH transport system substrate-binding protein
MMSTMLSGARGRLVVLLVFFAACATVMGVLFTGTGERIPVLDSGEYTSVVVLKDADNLVKAGRVQIAGVRVGQVRKVTLEPDGAHVEFTVDDNVAPLHRGLTVRLGERSLVGEGYLDVSDGHGAELASGSTIPASSIQPSVQLRDVLHSFDPASRRDLQGLLWSLGASTQGSSDDVAHLLGGLGGLGSDGDVALSAIAAQSKDLTVLARETATLMQALDTGDGQIASLVSNANRLTVSTSGQAEAIRQVLRQTPALLGTTRDAADSLVSLSGSLAPVAADLRKAAPQLSTALVQLPATTRDLRGLLSPLSGALTRAPATLRRVPGADEALRGLFPTVQVMLSDLNPMLAYIEPYGPDLAAYFANFNAVLNYTDENGASYLRLVPMVNTYSKQTPVRGGFLGNYTNPYPAPGTGGKPGPFKGPYPHVERAN